MTIALEEDPKGPYPFGVFHTSLGSTLCTKSELKSDWTVGDLPSSVEPLKGEIADYESDLLKSSIVHSKKKSIF